MLNIQDFSPKQKQFLILFIIILVLVAFLFISNKKVGIEPEKEINQEELTNEEVVDENQTIEEAVDNNTSTNQNTDDNLAKYKELIKKGHEMYLAGKYTEALDYFNQAVKLQQNDRIYRSFYTVYLALGDYAKAEQAIKTSINFNPVIPNNWVEYASFANLYMKKSFTDVSKIYEDALKATKDNINVVTSYASFLTESQKYEEAIKYLEKAITINPKNKDIYQKEIDYLKERM